MINARELKTGNKVLVNGIEREIFSIVPCTDGHTYGFNCFEGDMPEFYDYDCEPIHLTPEILERCGFEVSQYIGTGDFYISGSKVIKVGSYNYKIVVFAQDYDTWLLNYITNPLFSKDVQKEITASLLPFQHLHQLQNIWLDFTGQELEIKELKHA